MVFDYYQPGYKDPGQLNACLTSSGGYAAGCLADWSRANVCAPPGVTYEGTESGSLAALAPSIDSELAAGYPVLADVRYGNNDCSYPDGQHMVVIVGKSGSTYVINDPWETNPGAFHTLNESDPALGSTPYVLCKIRKYHGPVGPGSLITDDGTTVYWRQHNRIFHVLDAPVLDAMQNAGLPGWNWGSIAVVSSLAPYSVGPEFVAGDTRSDGLLIKQVGSNDVYLLQNGVRRWIRSPEARDWMGNSWENDVLEVSSTIVSNYVPGTGNDIYGAGEGESNSTIKSSFQAAYTTNANDAQCANAGTWKGWPGAFSECLGFPIVTVGDAYVSGASGITGKYQNFGAESGEKATINYSSQGTFAVHGAIFAKYKTLGFSGSALGFPTSDEFQDGVNRRSNFEGGYIYWNPSSNVTTVVYDTSSAPTVTTTAATAIGQYGATLTGSVNPNGSSTSSHFEYGTTLSYGSTTPTLSLGSGSSSIYLSEPLTFLACNTQYHFRAVATNASGTQYGADQLFTTGSCSTSKAQMISPVPGTTFASSMVTFSWTAGSGVSQYYLRVSTTFGGTDLYDASLGTNLWVTVSGLPTDGSTIYVALWSYIGSAWEVDDYTYTAFGACADDGYEEDDSCFGPEIGEGQPQFHLHCDQDWVWLTPVPGATYEIETSSLTGGADTLIELYRSCSTQLAVDDDGGVGLASKITYTASASDDFLDIVIKEFGSDYQAGEGYDVRVTCVANCSNCTAPPDVFLSNNMVNYPYVYVACNSITAGPDFAIENGADVTFQAGNSIVLGTGFSVAEGAEFKAVIDASVND